MREHLTTESATEQLASALQQNRRGSGGGVYSVCSAHRQVLEAAIHQAAADQSLLLVESTSNQVNQFGGYMSLTPAAFARYIREIATEQNFPAHQILLGGDHLGPHVWRKESSQRAMEKACTLIRDSVLAGYTKIHLDCSMPCADDRSDPRRPLPDEIVSERAARLCGIAESAHSQLPIGSPLPLYVIGTEVPIPGGEFQQGEAPEVTRISDLQRTIEIAKRAFIALGLESAWSRVIGIVTQPGVEFTDSSIFPYNSEKAEALSRFAIRGWHGVYEAHSTDYQSAAALRDLVRDHFAILKVGPWLTFAFREAVFALAAIEEEFLGGRPGVQLSQLRDAVDRAMIENPVYWQDYYHGTADEVRLARKYSYSDRARYYWNVPDVISAFNRLLSNLDQSPCPISLLSQYLPLQATLVRDGFLQNTSLGIIHSKIREVLQIYSTACRPQDSGTHAQ